MLKKILIYIILFSFLHLVGCYSTSIMNPAQYQELKDHIPQSNEIILNLNNNEKYIFARGYYFIINDTLIGEGVAIKNEIEEPYKGKIPLSQIRTIGIQEVDNEKTFRLVGTIILTGFLIYILIAWEEWKSSGGLFN